MSPVTISSVVFLDLNFHFQGGIKLSISLGQKTAQVIHNTAAHKGPFYLVVKQDVKDFEPPEGTVTGATNLMASNGLKNTYEKLTSMLT